MSLISSSGPSRNPNNPQIKGDRRGGVGDQNTSGAQGTVTDYRADTYTATVATADGRVIPGVGRMRSHPGDIAALPVGTEVLISWDWGFPIIVGIFPLPSGKNKGTATVSATDISGVGGQGENQSILPEGNYRNPGEPTDFIPGDIGTVGPEGNILAALTGGVNMLKSSPLSQIRTHLVNDLVEIISRNYRHITDMGESTITNENGRVNWCFRGGTDQRSETSGTEEKWTIRMDMGAVGDIFNLEFTTPKGQTLFKFHVDASGHCEIFGVNGVNISSGSRFDGGHSEEHSGNSTTAINGSKSTSVGGAQQSAIAGNATQDVGGDLTQTVGNDWGVQALRDMVISAGRQMIVSAQGSLIPGGTALTFDIENGDWVVDIGAPTSPLSAFKMTTFKGDISHECTAAGDITNTTLLGNISNTSRAFKADTLGIPDSVVLGGAVLTSHLVKWEELYAYLSALHVALDTHVHGPPGSPPSPIGAPLTGLLLGLKSLTTGVTA